jgi:hypothetical protein
MIYEQRRHDRRHPRRRAADNRIITTSSHS